MKKRLPALVLIAGVLVFALFGCSQAASSSVGSNDANASAGASSSKAASAEAATLDDIAIVDAEDVLNLEDGAYLVDTRTPDEYAQGHIPGALNASYPKSTGGPCQSEENSASFRNAWAKLEIPKDAHVVVYCRTGVRASAAAAALVEDGYENVGLYEGSWTDWTSDSSRPVE